jgi:DNA-binding NarL/FixJ family response regulator
MPSGRKIQVLIADGDAHARRRLRNLLEAESDFDVVGEADGAEIALQLARWLRPNLMLIDPDLLSVRSAELARALATELPEVRLVLLTASAPRRSATHNHHLSECPRPSSSMSPTSCKSKRRKADVSR